MAGSRGMVRCWTSLQAAGERPAESGYPVRGVPVELIRSAPLRARGSCWRAAVTPVAPTIRIGTRAPSASGHGRP